MQTAQLIVSTLQPIFSTFSGFTLIPNDIPSFYLFAYFGTPLHWWVANLMALSTYQMVKSQSSVAVVGSLS